jgi:hypothetical protein
MDIERTSNGQIYFVVRNRPFTFAPINKPINPIKMNNNDELIELLKRMHDILHQAYETEQGNVTANLPAELSTDEAMVLWKKAQKAGFVDEHYQPLISRTQAAVLAHAMAQILGIKNKWKVFETLWKRKGMYRDYYQALDQKQSLVFQNKIKELLY